MNLLHRITPDRLNCTSFLRTSKQRKDPLSTGNCSVGQVWYCFRTFFFIEVKRRKSLLDSELALIELGIDVAYTLGEYSLSEDKLTLAD